MTTADIENFIEVPLCELDTLIDGHSKGFDPLKEGRDSMFVVRRGDKIIAWRNSCPHYVQARMAWRKDEFLNADKSQIVCGAHGALFEIETGVCTLGPCLGQKLTPVNVEIRDGILWVVGPYRPGRIRKPRKDIAAQSKAGHPQNSTSQSPN